MIAEKYQMLLSDWNAQDELYKPSVFWAEASKELVKEFDLYGLQNFRSLSSSLLFFVPTYGKPGNGFSEELIQRVGQALILDDITEKQRATFEQFSSGYDNALADYRVFKAANQSSALPNLNFFSESQVGNPLEQFEFDGQFFSRSALNYLLGLSFLKQFSDFSDINTILEIGGGFGTLGEIVHKTMSNTQYINVDIPPTSFASEYYLQQVIGESEISNYESTKDQECINISELKKMSVLNAWQIEKIKGHVDLFVNYISFQEMEPEIVRNYLQKVKGLGAKWLLLRNMREGKQLRKNHRFGVETPIFSEDYIDMLGGYQLVARNVVPFGYKTVDHFHSEIMLFKLENT